MITLYESDISDFVLYGSRKTIEDFINKAVTNFTKTNIIPTIDQIEDYITSDRWAKANISDTKIGFAKDGFEYITVKDLCKNIQNLCAFNLDDMYESLDEDVEYTDTIDAIYSELKRNFTETDMFVTMVQRPKRAVHVEVEKELPNNYLFDIDYYIYLDNDGRITMVSENDKPKKFIDVEAVIDFFYEYLNA